ncbi:hypothetical protein LSH36_446g02070 [Paralvinella palmiformis]|uniref:Uncharacterized protein n=1 Tax=Paralvinella palmiformis TaxID=53620 RepID=A0AAD9JAL1_9ANNE|nr:hypothetical protein LSH36_446g02070 [Paralvinella palmiformis]
MRCMFPYLNPDVVSTYLLDNPDFLDQFVAKHVATDQVEKWLVKKSGQLSNRIKQENNKHHNEVTILWCLRDITYYRRW